MSSNDGMTDFEIILRLAMINDMHPSSKRVLSRIKHFRGMGSPAMQEKLTLIYYSKYPKMAIRLVVQNYEVNPHG